MKTFSGKAMGEEDEKKTPWEIPRDRLRNREKRGGRTPLMGEKRKKKRSFLGGGGGKKF